eukprot:TRINITY_DN76979_c0_g1_i1.p1 TRINITY_DN76979_c0_g1~~TRINITY_DN76979_c0_g1_i1.p1  ORF type:complete len:338 (-),score=35.80 TRINITY_DN76979_c0_g1_i1:265-1221(-)
MVWRHLEYLLSLLSLCSLGAAEQCDSPSSVHLLQQQMFPIHRSKARSAVSPEVQATMSAGKSVSRGERLQEMHPMNTTLIRWLHVQKTGQTFAITALRYGCPRCADEYTQYLKTSESHTKVRDSIETYPPVRCCDPEKVFLEKDAWVHEPVRAKDLGHIVLMLRDPIQRSLSALSFFRGAALEKAKQGDPKAIHDMRKRFKNEMRQQSLFLMEGNEKQRTAVAVAERISGPDVLFVGLVEEWDLSIRLFHSVFEAPPLRPEELMNLHPTKNKQTDHYALPSFLHNITDETEDKLYLAGKTRFYADVDKFLPTGIRSKP